MFNEIFTRILVVLFMVAVFVVGLIVAPLLPGWVWWTIIGFWVLGYILAPLVKWLVGRE